VGDTRGQRMAKIKKNTHIFVLYIEAKIEAAYKGRLWARIQLFDFILSSLLN
jgi:hypothetical protein